MTPIVSIVEIDRPPEEVFAYVTDPSRFAEWQKNVVSGGVENDGPQSVGSRCTTTRRIGGAERTTTQEVTKLDPPRAWSVRGVDGPVRANVDVTVEPLDERTRSRVSISLQFVGHGIGKLIVPVFVRPQAGKEVASSCQNLKARLELSAD
jgi:uncharacterized protein YndB with AHSA1/START domain